MATEAASREVLHLEETVFHTPATPRIASRAANNQGASDAQIAWATLPCASRLRVLQRARHELARLAPDLAAAISPVLARTPADTMVSEILPLLDAIRFLERSAARILRPARLGRRGLPFWLSGIRAEVHRVPFGHVLVIGPSNYPLFLPGVQTFQALAAGNAVTWKPGLGGAPIAAIVADALHRSALPRDLLTVTEDTVEAAQTALQSGPDKVFFTGSSTTGKHLLRHLAETATPAVVELSGNDAVVVLPSADPDRVARALAFGMRLNGSATCMAPRRILLVDATASRRKLLLDRLGIALASVPPLTLAPHVQQQLQTLTADAEHAGATVIGDPASPQLRPILVVNANPGMLLASADIFAPVLMLMDVSGTGGVLAAQARCPFALTASVFGSEREARLLASQLLCGSVTINDLIVPTADPRVAFGGRRGSGFGVTRGSEGLLEMTAVKVVSARRSRGTRQYDATGPAHARFFASVIEAVHAGGPRRRISSLRRALAIAMELKKK